MSRLSRAGEHSTAFATLVLCLIFASSAAAQDQSSATVRVLAADGPLSVEVRSVGDAGVVRTGTADANRPAVLAAIQPGMYLITAMRAAAAGPATIEVELVPGEVVTLVAGPQVSSGSTSQIAALTITDRSHAGQTVALGTSQLRGMSSNASLWSLIDTLVPWTLVDVIDNGGIETGRRGLFGARDASWTWNSFVMDGIDLTDPARTGVPLQYPDMRTMEAVTVTTGIAPADVAAPGAQVTLVPRRPGAARHGGVEVAGTSASMVSSAQPSSGAPAISALHSWSDINGQFGGPLNDRLGFFVAGRRTQSEFLDRDAAVPRSGDLSSIFTHIIARPGDRDEVRIVSSGQWVTRPLEGGDAFLGRLVDERDTFVHAQGNWDRSGTGGSMQSVSAAFQRGQFAPDVDAAVLGGVIDRVYDGPVPSPVARQVSSRFDARAGFSFAPRRVGKASHTLRLNGTVARTTSTAHVLAAPPIAEMKGGIPARVWDFVVPSADSSRHLSQGSVSVADEIRMADQWAIDAGARVNLTRGSADGAARGLSLNAFEPRLSVRRNFPSVRVAAFGGIGRYHPQPPLSWLAFGDPGQPWARLSRWSDPNGDGAFQASERGPQLALGGFGAPVGSIDASLRLPLTTEFVLGTEARLGTALFIVTATIRHEHSLVHGANVGIPLSSYTVTFIPDQTDKNLLLPVYDRPPNMPDADQYLLTNPDDGTLLYHALDVTYEQPITPRLRMRVSALEWWTSGPSGAPGFHVNENDQGLVGELFQDPNTSSHAEGPNFFDRSYVLKWSGLYQAPYDIWASFSANYRDGQAFAGLITVPDLTQGPEIIQSYNRKQTRFTFTMLLDARIEKRFRSGSRETAVWVDFFNLANMDLEIEEDPIPGPGYRRTTAVQPPRTIRAGVRFDF